MTDWKAEAESLSAQLQDAGRRLEHAQAAADEIKRLALNSLSPFSERLIVWMRNHPEGHYGPRRDSVQVQTTLGHLRAAQAAMAKIAEIKP